MPGEWQKEIHCLWDELADFDWSQSKAANTHVMARLCELGGVWNATWAGAIRLQGADEADPLLGWRVAAAEALHPALLQSDDKHMAGVMEVWERRDIDPSFLIPLRNVGAFRTYSLRRDLPADWFDTPFYRKHYGFCDIHDVAFVAFPLNDVSESHFAFYSHHPIADETIALLAYALRGIKWFHRHLMLSHGLLVAKAPLTPAEQKVLQLLLTGATEKSIARQIGLADSTTHQHVVAIFRKYGVKSRAALMSLWLNGSGGTG